MLKSLNEIEKAIDMMFDEKCALQQIKARNMLKGQFSRALDRIARLEQTNKRLRGELEQDPEYQSKEIFNAVAMYMNQLNK